MRHKLHVRINPALRGTVQDIHFKNEFKLNNIREFAPLAFLLNTVHPPRRPLISIPGTAALVHLCTSYGGNPALRGKFSQQICVYTLSKNMFRKSGLHLKIGFFLLYNF